MANHLFVMHLAQAAAVGPVAADTLVGRHTAAAFAVAGQVAAAQPVEEYMVAAADRHTAAFAAAGRMVAVSVLRIAGKDAGTDFRTHRLAADFEAAYIADCKPVALAE